MQRLATSSATGKVKNLIKEGTIKYAGFTVEGQEFSAMDSAREQL